VYPTLLVILRLSGNIEGDGDDREDRPNRNLQKTASFIEVEPLNVYQSTHTHTHTHILLAALIFPK